MSFKTEQEEFWAGNFGTEYIQRNQGNALLASNLNFFANAMRSASNIDTCMEFGANIGMNLKALKHLYPRQEQHGVEINVDAARQLAEVIPSSQVHNCSILDFNSSKKWDLVLVKGVLIHIDPAKLPLIYEKLITACGKYLLVAEYYNPVPIAIAYRGHANRLFKRDFAGEIMDCFPQMKLVDYGFAYHRDTSFPQDDISWFLMECKI